MFTIKLTHNAMEDLQVFRKFEQSLILDSIEEQLTHEPISESRNKKKLRPNDLSKWELRLQKYRIFYDVDTKEEHVTIKAIGWKKHNKLTIRNREYPI